MMEITISRVWAGAVLTALISTSALAQDDRVMLDRVVAIVNDSVVTKTELDHQVELIEQRLRGTGTQLPPAPVLRRQVLEREISKSIQLQLARDTGIIVDDNELNNIISNVAAQNGLTLREFRDRLEREGIDFAEYREMAREERIIGKLQQREVASGVMGSGVVVTDQEVDNFLATQYAQGNVDDEFRLAHILVALPEAASPEQVQKAQARAQDILARLRGGADFRQTAIAVSDGGQALEGGDLGWRKAGELPTLFADRVRDMAVGEVSDIIRSPSGFHIIKLMDSRSGESHEVQQTRARHILIRPNELVSRGDAVSHLNQLKDRIQHGEDFAALARAHSEDRASAAQGGSLGWVSPGEMVPQFEEAMNALKPDEISEPFRSPFGWHIVQVQERRVMDNSEEFRRNQARDFIRQRKIQEALDNWQRQLRDEAYVEIKEDV